MVSERKKEERLLRKRRIINAALSVFDSLGIEKTTMGQIAMEAGFGKAQFVAVTDEGILDRTGTGEDLVEIDKWLGTRV